MRDPSRRDHFWRTRRDNLSRRAGDLFLPRPLCEKRIPTPPGILFRPRGQGRREGDRVPSHSDIGLSASRSLPSTRTKPLAPRSALSIQPQKRDSSKISFRGIRDLTPRIDSQERSGGFEEVRSDAFWVPSPMALRGPATPMTRIHPEECHAWHPGGFDTKTYRPINITSRIGGPPPWRPPSRVITIT